MISFTGSVIGTDLGINNKVTIGVEIRIVDKWLSMRRTDGAYQIWCGVGRG
jgi:hypothetical protein